MTLYTCVIKYVLINYFMKINIERFYFIMYLIVTNKINNALTPVEVFNIFLLF